MPLSPFSSSYHPPIHTHLFTTFALADLMPTCTNKYCSSVWTLMLPLFHFFHSSLPLLLPLSIIFSFFPTFPLISFLFSLPLPPSSFLSPLSLFPAFICSVSAPQAGCYVTVRWCVGPLKGLKGLLSWQTLNLPATPCLISVCDCQDCHIRRILCQK